MDVSDRRMQVQLTQEAKIASDFYFIRAIFAVVGFVSALKGDDAMRSRHPLCFYASRKSGAGHASSRRLFSST